MRKSCDALSVICAVSASVTIIWFCSLSAQLLYVISEDNQDAIRLVASSTSYLTHLESVLAHPLPDNSCGCGQMLIVRAAVTGLR